MSEHRARITWTRNTPDFTYDSYDRGHEWSFPGGISVPASSTPEFRGRTEREVVMVPESAVVPRAGEFLIFRVEDGKAVESKVGLGNRRAGMVEVTSGLLGGATVVTAGHQRLKDGSPVDVVNAAARPRQGRGS